MTESLHRLASPVPGAEPYFPLSFQMSADARRQLALPALPAGVSRLYRLRAVADRLWHLRADADCSAGRLELLAVLSGVLRWLAHRHLRARHCEVAADGVDLARRVLQLPGLRRSQEAFVGLFPPQVVLDGMLPQTFLYGPFGVGGRIQTLLELLVLSVQSLNPAARSFRCLFDDGELVQRVPYRATLQALDCCLRQAPIEGALGEPLLEMLQAPVKASPDSLEGQLEYVRRHWQGMLPSELLQAIDAGLAVRAEEMQMRGGGPGPLRVPDYPRHLDLEEERFSPDSDWMSNLVLIAKSVHVWFDQLARHYGRSVTRLREIPDEELDQLARRGFTGLWLIGVWERSQASQRIKRMRGNPEAVASAYSLYDYRIADELGGQADLEDLDRRCRRRGIRLACDVVPNHTGIDSRWMQEHPDWFVQVPHPPYPAYRFTGPDLSGGGGMGVCLEDGYWDHSDASVVFKRVDHHTGEVRYIYHGNDGTHLPWNDTAQLNFLLPQVREAMIRTIIEVARTFRVIRFDAAMTLAKKHFQRLWFPLPGGGAGVPSRAEHSMSADEFERLFPVEFWREVVDRVAAEVPDTLLLAEAFWLMESYFVRTLGMHRVYNSAFMHMMKQEDNAKYRQLLKKTLAFNPEILKRFVNFMNNPDEATAVEQFGKGDKYFGVAVLLATLPGLPMFGHGQVEGFQEKYGMEYRRAYLQEEVDRGFVAHHEQLIFPLLHRRALFSGAEHFVLYDFATDGRVNEDVLAFSNRRGEQRALVVYHNRPVKTGGWLHDACPESARTLAAGLALSSGGGTFYRFRDHCSGLHYLRTAEELAGQGLFVSLQPYQACVFLDFIELTDRDGIWRQVWQRLEGRPVADLDREYLRLRHADLLQALEQLLAAGGDFPRLDPEHRELALRRYAAFLQRLQAELQLPGDFVRLTERLKGQMKLAEDLPEATLAPALNLLWPWLVLHGIGEPPSGEDRTARVEEWLDRYLLAEVVSNRWVEDEAAENLLLLRLLIRYQERSRGEVVDWLKALLDEPEARAYLLVNAYQGVEWFNRERLERLVAGLAGCAALAGRFPAGEEAAYCERMVASLLNRAEEAGCRLEKFRELV